MPEEYFGKCVDEIVHGALPNFVKQGGASGGLMGEALSQLHADADDQKDQNEGDEAGGDDGDKDDDEEEDVVPVECAFIDFRFYKFEKKVQWVKDIFNHETFKFIRKDHKGNPITLEKLGEGPEVAFNQYDLAELMITIQDRSDNIES